MIKNYALKLINKEEQIGLTAEQAAVIVRAMNDKDSKCVFVNGSVYAIHQIVAIERIDKETEKDLCEMKNINQKELATLEDYLSPNKQLTNGRNR